MSAATFWCNWCNILLMRFICWETKRNRLLQCTQISNIKSRRSCFLFVYSTCSYSKVNKPDWIFASWILTIPKYQNILSYEHIMPNIYNTYCTPSLKQHITLNRLWCVTRNYKWSIDKLELPVIKIMITCTSRSILLMSNSTRIFRVFSGTSLMSSRPMVVWI